MKNILVRTLGLITGFVFWVFAYALNEFGILRMILLFLGIIAFCISCVVERKRKALFSILFFIIFAGLSLVLDYIVVKTFKKIPVVTFNIISIDKVKIYNSIGYRVWSCDKNSEYIIDPSYKLGYFCDNEDMASTDVNVMLSNIVNDYDKYSNTFIKINGKISSVSGNEYLELEPYVNGETLNNKVEFSTNITLRVNFNQELAALSNYKIYDNVEIIGRVNNISKNNDEYLINMVDSSLVNNSNYNNFKISVNTLSNCEYDKKIIYNRNNTDIYTSCISSAFIKYSDTETFDLSYALENNKITMDKFLEKANSFKMTEGNSNVLFLYDNFNVVKCNNSYIIGDTSLDLFSKYCEVKSDSEEVGL